MQQVCPLQSTADTPVLATLGLTPWTDRDCPVLGLGTRSLRLPQSGHQGECRLPKDPESGGYEAGLPILGTLCRPIAAAHVVAMLGHDEGRLHDLALELDSEYGRLWSYGTADEATPAFASVERLRELIVEAAR